MLVAGTIRKIMNQQEINEVREIISSPAPNVTEYFVNCRRIGRGAAKIVMPAAPMYQQQQQLQQPQPRYCAYTGRLL